MQATVAPGVAAPRGRASRIEHWAPASGIVSVALLVAALVIGVTKLDTGDKLPKIAQHFGSDDYRTTTGVVLLLMLLGVAAFLWFLADLSSSARAVSQGMLAFLVPVAGVVFIVSVAASLGSLVAPLWNINHSELAGSDPTVTATAYQLISSVSFSFMILAGVSGGLLMGAAATTAYRGGFLPRWAAITVIVAAVVAVVGTFIFVFPILLILVWILVASTRRTLLVRRGVLAGRI